jgi:hypothetical protein
MNGSRKKTKTQTKKISAKLFADRRYAIAIFMLKRTDYCRGF